MVWLVQNCRSNKCLKFLKPPRASRVRPLGPLPVLCLGPAGDAVPRPLAYSRPPNHKSYGKDIIFTQWIKFLKYFIPDG